MCFNHVQWYHVLHIFQYSVSIWPVYLPDISIPGLRYSAATWAAPVGRLGLAGTSTSASYHHLLLVTSSLSYPLPLPCTTHTHHQHQHINKTFNKWNYLKIEKYSVKRYILTALPSAEDDVCALELFLKLFEQQPQSKSECCAEMRRNFAMENIKIHEMCSWTSVNTYLKWTLYWLLWEMAKYTFKWIKNSVIWQ